MCVVDWKLLIMFAYFVVSLYCIYGAALVVYCIGIVVWTGSFVLLSLCFCLRGYIYSMSLSFSSVLFCTIAEKYNS